MVFVFLFLISFSMIISRSIHVAENGLISCFLMAESHSIIYIYTHIYIYIIIIHTHTHTHIYIYHIFFIHSPVDGHLGCFYVLAIVNGAAVNIGVYISWSFLLIDFGNKSKKKPPHSLFSGTAVESQKTLFFLSVWHFMAPSSQIPVSRQIPECCSNGPGDTDWGVGHNCQGWTVSRIIPDGKTEARAWGKLGPNPSAGCPDGH